MSYHKNTSLWKEVLNKFFSNVNILEVSFDEFEANVVIANLSAFNKCCGYFTLPDYQRSIRSTIKKGSICSIVQKDCWSNLRNYKGIPTASDDNGLIDIGYRIKNNIKEQARSPGK